MAHSVVAATSGAVLGQRIASAVVRAGIASIPFASLAWDAVTATLEFVNDREAEVFLDELAKRRTKIRVCYVNLLQR